MAKFDERLTHEHLRCYPYGPIFAGVIVPLNKKQLNVGMALDFKEQCPEPILEYLKLTVRAFWNFSAKQLSAWSRLKDSPWDKAESLDPLDDREITRFFKDYIAFVEVKGRENEAKACNQEKKIAPRLNN